VQDGAQGRICPSVWPQWQTTAQSFMIRYATKNWDLILGKRSAAAAATENRESEDCLFLDVVVPKKVFDSKTAAPVLGKSTC
jgi:carboxylesterase type B